MMIIKNIGNHVIEYCMLVWWFSFRHIIHILVLTNSYNLNIYSCYVIFWHSTFVIFTHIEWFTYLCLFSLTFFTNQYYTSYYKKESKDDKSRQDHFKFNWFYCRWIFIKTILNWFWQPLLMQLLYNSCIK